MRRAAAVITLAALAVTTAMFAQVASQLAKLADCGPAPVTLVASVGGLPAVLHAIATHESGGDPKAQNPSSTASGKYQFLTSTWQPLARRFGYPQWANGPASAAPEAVQDAVALAYAQSVLPELGGNLVKLADVWYLGRVLADSDPAMDRVPGGGNSITPRQYEAAIAKLMGQAATTGADGYVNPFGPAWQPARTDQGVDWAPIAVTPVVAIGAAVVTYSSTTTGWPGGAFLTYQLTAGSHAGAYIYVAEHLTDLLPVGARVAVGDRLATALPGYPWLETGYAAPTGDSPASPYAGAPDGTATAGGKAFARFLKELGATPLDDPGPGPDSVTGAAATVSSCGSTTTLTGLKGFYPGDAGEPRQTQLFGQVQARYGHADAVVLMEDVTSPQNMDASTDGHFATPGAWRDANPKPLVVISAGLAFGSFTPNANVSAQALAATAAGRWDRSYVKLATELLSAGYPSAVVRLGWEFDGDWMPWEATHHPDLYVAAFRHVHDVMHAAVPGLRFDWTGAAGQLFDGTLAYPGDGYVDIVGMDIYDTNQNVASQLGPRAAFARAHGKQVSYAEWALSSIGGDHPAFIQAMHDFMAGLPASGPGSLAYESYFQADPTGDRIAPHALDNYPQSLALYRRLFG